MEVKYRSYGLFFITLHEKVLRDEGQLALRLLLSLDRFYVVHALLHNTVPSNKNHGFSKFSWRIFGCEFGQIILKAPVFLILHKIYLKSIPRLYGIYCENLIFGEQSIKERTTG